MNVLPEVVSETELSNSFLSETTQICVVSRDCRRTMEGFVRMGIGPWRIYRYTKAADIRNTEFREKPETFHTCVCLAWTGQMMWEIIQPLDGETIYNEFLEKHGEGIHHVAFAAGDMPYEDQINEFQERGMPVIQSGLVKGTVRFHYFGTEESTSTTFEIYDPKGRDLPESDEWFPGPPPK